MKQIQINTTDDGWCALFSWDDDSESIESALISPTDGRDRYEVFMPGRHGGPGGCVAFLCERDGRWEVDWEKRLAQEVAEDGHDTCEDAIRAVVCAMIQHSDWR